MVGIALIVAVTSVLDAVVQPLFVASTQYEVVDDIEEVVKLVPVPKELPNVDAEYQLMVPADALAPNVTVPVPHLEPIVVPVIVGIVFTVTANVRAVPSPQALEGVTCTFPDPAPTVTVTEFVVPPTV